MPNILNNINIIIWDSPYSIKYLQTSSDERGELEEVVLQRKIKINKILKEFFL